jgi:hypothetical protein
MKKLLFILPLTFLITLSASAQERAFQFGFKFSPNLGWIKPNSDGYERNGMKVGLSWGVHGDIYLMENYSINTGFNINYINGAYNYPHKVGTNTGILDRTVRLKYFQIPATLRMKTKEIDNFTFYGEFGLGLGFMTGAKADDVFTVNNQVISDTKKTDVKKEFRFSRESLILGAGTYYRISGATKLTAGLRFDNNFFDILKNQNTVNPSISQKAIANFLEVHVGILF